jgi:sterol desaturase/sphingolipid hydroxylase (fatty acid hydroxylase superfamily)
LLVLGVPAALVFWQFVAATITGLVGHANIRCRIPAFLHRLAVTPEFYCTHHAADSQLGNSNYGVVFPFWDMAFGTHADPLPRQFVEELKSPITYGKLVAHRQQAT